MLPVEELYKATSAFTRRQFTREGALMIWITYIAEDLGVDYELDTLVKEVENVMKNLGFYEIANYESDVVRILKSIVKNYNQP